MPIISLLNEKGGSGKSTTSLHFAFWLYTKKKKVQIVDSDPQKSCSKWVAAMGNPIPVTILTTPDDLLDKIPELAAQTDFLVIDAPPGLAESSRAILFRTDLAVIPCQPSGLDLDAASDAIRLIKQAQSVRGGLPKAAIFINRASKGTRLKDEAVSLINNISTASALKTTVHQRQAIADAFGQGATVFDLKGSGASDAAAEFEQLFKEIIKLLK